MGIAFQIVRTPQATRPTKIEVVVEELCTRLVARIPINNPINELEVVFSNASAKPLP
jgi:hypothetical protein